MSRKILTASLGLALSTLGCARDAQAIHLSTDGRGQVLIYPYYTVNGGNATLLSVVNTTEDVKALKVRFREAMNGQLVLDFNLYLGPLDVWTGALTGDSEALDPVHAAAAVLQTADSSCTVPRIPAEGQSFDNFEYDFNNEDGGPYEDSRTRSGYIEIIEMGRLTGEFAAAASLAEAGVPTNCQRLVDAWHWGTQGQANGIWRDQPNEGLLPPTGGLYGGAEIVDVTNGTNLSYSADAIDGFYTLPTGSLHHSPNNWKPDLGSARMAEDGTVSAYVIDEGELIRLDFDESTSQAPGLKAMSAVLMREWIYNEFEISPGFATEWVVTFPTRGLHLAYPIQLGVGNDDREPFSISYAPPTESLVDIGDSGNYRLQITNREAKLPFNGPFFGGQPGYPGSLNFSANVIGIAYGGAYGWSWFWKEHAWHGGEQSDLLGSYDTSYINPISQQGMAQLKFSQYYEFQLQDRNGHIIYGLPVLGFSAIRATLAGNGSALANFSVIHRHHMKTTVEAADGQ
ncbi:MAG: hypothetical protein R3F04_11525 [Lysobacteraceae bacterium]